MNTLRNKVIRAVCLLAIGGLLVCVSEQAPLWITQGIGTLFGLSGIFSLLSLFRKDVGRRETVLYPVLGLASLALGVYLIGWPASVVSLLLYLLAGLLVLAGCVQAVSRLRMQRMGIKLNAATYFIPLLTVGAGVFVALYPLGTAAVPFIILGAAYILYALLELWSALELHRWQKQQEKVLEEGKATEDAVAEEVTDSEATAEAESSEPKAITADVETED
ncbi:MAG: DUF308 domain-containing protein [Alloprevotella sp.]|nr:DUF308 domain-containing protein [Alloprevotella sp.]